MIGLFSFMFFLSSVYPDQFVIPSHFQEGQLIEQLVVISDVDGVVRDSIDAIADPRVIDAVYELLSAEEVHLAFLSGTPVENDQSIEPWRRGNVPLNHVFKDAFVDELLENRVAIYGVLGGQRMKANGHLEVIDEYPAETVWELGKLLLKAFLQEVLATGSLLQKEVAGGLQEQLDALLPTKELSSHVTSEEFGDIIRPIRQHLDPHFRLICSGVLIETHSSSPLWGVKIAYDWMKNELDRKEIKAHFATGFAKKGEEGFNFLSICKTNKGKLAQWHIEEKLKQFPNALVVTIGDTQVDFPMHEKAHLAFHVGKEKVWLDNSLSHCVMIRDVNGVDQQHVEGTLKVLSLLKEAIGKSFYDFKHIPKKMDSGQWEYYSIRELQEAGPQID